MNEVTRYDLTEDVSTGGLDITPVPERMEGRYVTFEDYEALAQQLTATTNSLTNAQEALKSAGIEADTVQAGVIELKDKLTLVREQRDSELNRNTKLEAKLAQLEKQTPVEYWVLDSNEEVIARRSTVSDAQETVDRWNQGWVIRPVFARPAPAIDLNAVRADVLLQFFNEQMEWALVNWQWSNFTSLERAAMRDGDCELSGVILMLKKIADFENEIRAGNAGKDGV